MKVVWFNCAAGIAGDMALAALVDAGADAEAIAGTIEGLGIEGWALTFERVRRGSMSALQASVAIDGAHGGVRADGGGRHPHRPVGEILALLDAADLPERVRTRARSVFSTLAIAEGEVHDVDPADVELHEVGSLDAIVDVVGVCAALESLDVERVTASPIGLGHGGITTAHGELATPAPAVARLLATHQIPVTPVASSLETATPTGVALLAALGDRFGPPPTMTVAATGFGAGAADPPERPNVVNVLVGAGTGLSTGSGRADELLQVETNVDDIGGEVIAHTIEALLAAGAHDAWASPIVMKKGRPAHTIHVLTDAARARPLTELLLRETGSLGSRATTVTRTAAERDVIEVDVDGHAVRVKRSASRMKVEFDDAARAAEALGRPVRDVLRDAESRAHDREH
jgi:uncharacterized protein (TIGR00299 family) protein